MFNPYVEIWQMPNLYIWLEYPPSSPVSPVYEDQPSWAKKMGQMQRRKGQVGEREAAALIREHTGWEVTRRVRNAAGDSDLLGVPGWSVEIRRYANASASQIASWWDQCVGQADGEIPVLFYRLNRGQWRDGVGG
jgi:hypothetical protein